MELVVRKNDLLRELQLFQGIVERKNTIPILANVLMEAKGEQVSFLATDGHRLALVTVPRDGKAKKDAEENKAILPKKTLGELGRLLMEGDGDINYERGENHLFFAVGERLLISRMIDGQFPAYERVIP